MIPTSLYIHIPWCEKKCPYCDFNSHRSTASLPEEQYLLALINDLEADLYRYNDIDLIDTIFIGGGTPSLMSGHFYKKLLREIASRVTIKENAEITIEANPSSTEIKKFLEYNDAGINRLSLGIQSFNNKHLSKLGRIHDSSAAVNAIHGAKAAGFKRINLDLMFGLPDQTLNEALSDLHHAIGFDVDHISWYQLTIEKNTIFYREKPQLPSSDLQSDMHEAGKTLLSNNGYEQYEISAYSKNSPCQHNLNYWGFGDYLGIGAGAHGKISKSLSKPLTITRSAKTRTPTDYLAQFDPNTSNHSSILLASESRDNAHPSIKRYGVKLQTISEDEFMLEFLMNALRLRSGFSIETALERANFELSDLKAAIPQAFELELLSFNKGRVSTTEDGWRFIDTILEMVV